MKLSILIATLPNRAHLLARMIEQIGPLGDAEIVVDNRDKHIPTGSKRNDLIQRASGEWVVFVDDDDTIDPSYLSEIMKALEQNPDCVTFQGTYHDVQNPQFTKMNWTIKLGEKYEARGNHIYRWPNHLAVIRKSIAGSVKFPDVWRGEDYEWSKQINDRGLIKTEVHIPKQLYHYVYLHQK